jgi:hypothetical protein
MMRESVRAMPGLIDAVAQAIYEANIPKVDLKRNRLSDQNWSKVPPWTYASDEVREWVHRQAMAATRVVDRYLAKQGEEP